MLRLFRHIRQRLFLEGRVSRYFGYAIGEIVLIVVGILIALQINNWNEKRLQGGDVANHLSAIRSDLEKEATVFRGQLDYLSKQEDAMAKLTEYFESRNLSQKEVEKYFGLLTSYLWLRPITSAYESFKASGLPLSNTELESNLANYFEDQQDLLESTVTTHEHNYKTYFWPFMRKHFETYSFENPVTLKDWPKEVLKEDFLTEANILNVMMYLLRTRMEDLLSLNKELITLIDEELIDRGIQSK